MAFVGWHWQDDVLVIDSGISNKNMNGVYIGTRGAKYMW
jgi:hypothetical protein